MTSTFIPALRSVSNDPKRSLLYILTIAFLIMVILAPTAIANGYSKQLSDLIPSLTVMENIELPMALAGVKGEVRKRRAMELLERFGLSRLADKLPSQLSGGEQQRVAVLRALANEPDIILADEPTANLDEENSEILLDLFKEINREELVTIILTTVSVEERLPTNHDYILRNGKLYQIR